MTSGELGTATTRPAESQPLEQSVRRVGSAAVCLPGLRTPGEPAMRRHGTARHAAAVAYLIATYAVWIASRGCAATSPEETQALMDLYRATGGDTGHWLQDDNWGTDGDPCGETGVDTRWFGVMECGPFGVVRKLMLPGNRLTGRLPASIGNLSSLVELDLSHNAIVGPIPDTIGQIPGLSKLTLASNFFESLPYNGLQKLTALTEIDFSQNQLDGPMFPHLNLLTELQIFTASENSLTGDVPSLCTNHPEGIPETLWRLDLRKNALTGWNLDDPPDCSPSQQLSVLDASHNDVSVATQNFPDFAKHVLAHVPVTQFRMNGNNNFMVELQTLTQYLMSAVAIDVSQTRVYGQLPTAFLISPVLSLFWVAGCPGVRGALPDDRSTLRGIVTLDITGTSMRAAQLPPYLVPGLPAPAPNANQSAYCRPPVTGFGDVLTVALDASYDSYTRCGCVAGYEGIGTECTACSRGTWSDQGDTACQPCPAGFHQYGSRRDGRSSCIPCPDNKFSYPGTAGCFHCPDGATCVSGSLSIEEGRWWPNTLHLSNSTQLYRCLSTTSCLSPNVTELVNGAELPARCADGCDGVLCATCMEGWARDGPGKCVSCPSTPVVLGLSVAAIVAGIVFVFRTMRTDTRTRRGTVKSEGRSAFRILISYLQLLSMANNEFHSGGAAVLRYALGVVGSIGGDSFGLVITSPLQCALQSRYDHVLIAAGLLPIICVGILGCVLRASRSCKCHVERHSSSRVRRRTVKEELLGVTAAVIFLVYTRVTQMALGAFQNHSEPIQGVYYLQADFRMWDGSPGWTTMQVTAFVILAVYTVAAPLGAAVSLSRAPGTSLDASQVWTKGALPRGGDLGQSLLLDDAAGQAVASRGLQEPPHPLNILRRGYKPGVWWWEITVAGRKVAFAALSVFVADPTTQVVSAAMLLSCLLSLQFSRKPYVDARLNRAEALSLFALLATQLCGLAYPATSSTADDATADATSLAQAVLTISLLALNGAALLNLLRLCLFAVSWSELGRRMCWCCSGSNILCFRGGKVPHHFSRTLSVAHSLSTLPVVTPEFSDDESDGESSGDDVGIPAHVIGERTGSHLEIVGEGASTS